MTVVNLKEVVCSKAGCPNLFWIDELTEGLVYCSNECSDLELSPRETELNPTGGADEASSDGNTDVSMPDLVDGGREG